MLRDADVPQRFEFSDFDLVCNIRAAKPGEDGHLHWEWFDDVDWEPRVKMAMSSETANKYFQGRENVAMAIARREPLDAVVARWRPEVAARIEPRPEFREAFRLDERRRMIEELKAMLAEARRPWWRRWMG